MCKAICKNGHEIECTVCKEIEDAEKKKKELKLDIIRWIIVPIFLCIVLTLVVVFGKGI